MKLSEAIRLGAMLTEQARWHNFLPVGVHDWGETKATCALAAALHAVGVPWRKVLNGDIMRPGLRADRPQLPGTFVIDIPVEWKFPVPNCPECAWPYLYIHPVDCARMLAHLNDEHAWSRERIADWLETVEPSVQDSPTFTGYKRTIYPERTRA